MAAKSVKIGDIEVANDAPLTLIAGPCVLESRAHGLEMSQALKEIATQKGVALIYKSSFDKANRTSLDGVRGVGLDESLEIFAEIKQTTGLPVLTAARR